MQFEQLCPFVLKQSIMLTEFLNRLLSSSGKLEYKTPAYLEVLAGESKEEAPSVIVESKYDDPEIAVIDKYYGPLTEGLVIEAALSDMLRILPRTRRKSDSYKGLVGRLKALGVQLRVSSQYESKLNGNEERED